MQNADSAAGARVLSAASMFRMLALILLFVLAAILECAKLSALRDPEIWGHLSIGSWILEHRALPASGVFSQAGDLPWSDLSWGFDCIVALVYRFAGLRALPGLLIFFRVTLALVTFLVAGGWRNFWSAAALSAVAQYILFSLGPLAAFVSLSFFGVELLLLLDVRDSRNRRALFVLPALFFLWANLDTGFVYGIVLYVLFIAALLLEHWDAMRKVHRLDHPAAQVPLPAAVWVGGACLLASCLTPNTFHAYFAFFAGELSPLNHNLVAYNAMGFRQPQDYVLMILAMVAFLSLGFLRSRDLFQIGLLCGGTALAFHGQRENWLLVLASVAIVGRAIPLKSGKVQSEPLLRWNWPRLAPVGAALILAFLVFAFHVPRNQDVLLAKVAEKLPVRAADFLRRNLPPAPLFNSYQWGGFLTWYLPEYPVAIDARRGLYPEERELDYFKVMNAEIPIRTFPPMNNARTVLLDKAGIMAEGLRGVAGFHVLYEDDISIAYLHEVQN